MVGEPTVGDWGETTVASDTGGVTIMNSFLQAGKALSLFRPPALSQFLSNFSNKLVNFYTSCKAQLLESLPQHQGSSAFQLLTEQTTITIGKDVGFNSRAWGKSQSSPWI